MSPIFASQPSQVRIFEPREVEEDFRPPDTVSSEHASVPSTIVTLEEAVQRTLPPSERYPEATVFVQVDDHRQLLWVTINLTPAVEILIPVPDRRRSFQPVQMISALR